MTDDLLQFLASRAETVPLKAHNAVKTRAEEQKCINADVNNCPPPFDVYLDLKWYHADPLPWLLKRIGNRKRKQDEKYIDKEFPLCDKTSVRLRGGSNPPSSMLPGILTSSNCCDFRESGPRKSRRIQQYVCNARQWAWIRASDMKGPALFAAHNSIDPRHVLQGKVGNCGLCSAIASLAAEWPDLIRTTFGEFSEGSLSSVGAYSVRLFPKGQQRYLLLDDYILCRTNECHSSPSMHSCLSGDLWIRLLEKALVKIQGSLASLDGIYKYKSLYRHPARALQLLTGSSTAMELHFASSGSTAEIVYSLLRATQGQFARVVHCRSNMCGLHSNHGYSFLWIGRAAGEALVCLRNPHGRGSYTGRYGFGSWQAHDEVASDLLSYPYFVRCPETGRVTWRRRVEGSTVDEDDGIFFMEFSVFVQCFPLATIVGPIGGCRNNNSTEMTDAPDCIFKVHGAQLRELSILLDGKTQDEQRASRTLKNESPKPRLTKEAASTSVLFCCNGIGSA